MAPGGIDCTAVLADVFLYIDDEGDVDARERIRAHLDDCSPCLRQYGVERDVKALIARCCGGDIAPERLRSSIRVSLSSVTFEDGSSVESSSVEYRQGF
ncbi:mycothiol system anti-sigma-R factor [Jatrophihabitans sp. YIM 134969]